MNALCTLLAAAVPHASAPAAPTPAPSTPALFELWPDAARERTRAHDFVLDAAANVRAEERLLELLVDEANSQPCARFAHQALPFVSSRNIQRCYTGAAPLQNLRLEVCVRQAQGQGYENRTPFIPLSCTFTGFGAHVKVAVGDEGERVLYEFDAFVPPRTYGRFGYDGQLDFVGASGTYEQTSASRRAQQIMDIPVADEAFYRKPFTCQVSVEMFHGSILGMGAYTAKVDGDGFAPAQGSGLGGGTTLLPNGASVAVVFHWNETELEPRAW